MLNMDLKQHFTDAKDINLLMCKILGDLDNLALLEPCVGEGAFLENIIGTPSNITCIDIDPKVIEKARNKNKHPSVKFLCQDFIEENCFKSDLFRNKTENYDAVISNPPYGLHLDLVKRKQLKKAFPSLYVRESYGLFFIFSIMSLKERGRYVFLIPDTFLASKNHTSLRRFMINEAAPDCIIRFPSKKFQTINFGYGNLCIISGSKNKLSPSSKVSWLDIFDENHDLNFDSLKQARQLNGEQLIACVDRGWSLSGFSVNNTKSALDWVELGSLAECKTGIYTGDNGRFIGYDPSRINKRLNGHPIDWIKVISKEITNQERFEGVDSDTDIYVQLIRGGHRAIFEQTPWAIKWSTDAVSFYKSNNKARFQNSTYYFRCGIAVPMVTTKRISASLMSNAVFDQGVVGVFPNDRNYCAALLLYLNSNVASLIMKSMVNGSANNSANYLKRLLVPFFTPEEIATANSILSDNLHLTNNTEKVCNDFVNTVMARITKSGKMLDLLVAA